jgi:hypothetical protein
VKLTTPLALTLLLTGCTGLVDQPDASTSTDDAGVDAGPPIIALAAFTLRSDGWPTGEPLLGAALLDNVLYAASASGLRALPLTQTAWQPVSTPDGGRPSSLQRLGTTLVATVGSGTGKGVWTKTVDTEWLELSGAPAAPAWALTRRGTEYLLATSKGLYAANDLASSWGRRTAAAPFTGVVDALVAGVGQQRLFAIADGGLTFSDSAGATWAGGLVTGQVTTLSGSGAYVFAARQADAGELRSDNYGATFKPMPTPVGAPVAALLFDQSLVWAGTSAGLETSDDLGVSWSADTHGLPAGLAVRRVVVAGSLLVVDTADGPYVTQFQ